MLFYKMNNKLLRSYIYCLFFRYFVGNGNCLFVANINKTFILRKKKKSFF